MKPMPSWIIAIVLLAAAPSPASASMVEATIGGTIGWSSDPSVVGKPISTTFRFNPFLTLASGDTWSLLFDTGGSAWFSIGSAVFDEGTLPLSVVYSNYDSSGAQLEFNAGGATLNSTVRVGGLGIEALQRPVSLSFDGLGQSSEITFGDGQTAQFQATSLRVTTVEVPEISLPSVPLPPALPMFAAALLGLGALRQSRRSKAALLSDNR